MQINDLEHSKEPEITSDLSRILFGTGWTFFCLTLLAVMFVLREIILFNNADESLLVIPTIILIMGTIISLIAMGIGCLVRKINQLSDI